MIVKGTCVRCGRRVLHAVADVADVLRDCARDMREDRDTAGVPADLAAVADDLDCHANRCKQRPPPAKLCAVCGKDLGPGPFADGAPYACSLACFYALHPEKKP